MKNLKKMIATLGLAVVMMMTVSTANAGIIIGEKGNTNQPCTERNGDKTDWGMIITDFTGVISAGFTGVISAGFTGIILVGAADAPVDCGVISAG